MMIMIMMALVSDNDDYAGYRIVAAAADIHFTVRGLGYSAGPFNGWQYH